MKLFYWFLRIYSFSLHWRHAWTATIKETRDERSKLIYQQNSTPKRPCNNIFLSWEIIHTSSFTHHQLPHHQRTLWKQGAANHKYNTYVEQTLFSVWHITTPSFPLWPSWAAGKYLLPSQIIDCKSTSFVADIHTLLGDLFHIKAGYSTLLRCTTGNLTRSIYKTRARKLAEGGFIAPESR